MVRLVAPSCEFEGILRRSRRGILMKTIKNKEEERTKERRKKKENQ
jgi:hypothetical protein